MPFFDNSIEIVYTCHAIEPNGGHEKELLQELYRVTSEYLILLEPAYDLAGIEAKDRMMKHGYSIHLYDKIMDLGYEVMEHRLWDISTNPLNPTGLTIIKKNKKFKCKAELCCPITKKKMVRKDDCYYSPEGMIAYPIIGGIPCLTSQNAIVATKFGDYI